MRSGIVYFPYIHLPDNQWLYRSLLYWDEVATIVPLNYEVSPSALLWRLADVGLVRPIEPEPIIYRKSEFVDSFLEYVDDEAYPVKPGALTRGESTFSIHPGKLAGITEPLMERGLAEPGQYPWVEVERFTAGKFMAYLAAIIGGVENLSPATDRPERLSAFVSLRSGTQAFQAKLDPDRTDVLEAILPAPSRMPNLRRLREFKDKHRDELHAFRVHVEDFLLELQDSPSREAKELKIERFRERMDEEIGRLQSLMKEGRLGRPRLGTLFSLSSASFGVAAASLATGPGALFGAVAAALGLVGGAYSTYKRIKDSNERVRQSFAAYAMAYRLQSSLGHA